MSGNEHFDRLRQIFADQFEADGDGFLYRKYSKAAPIQVSPAERDRYIAAFDKVLKYSVWGIGGGTVIVIVAFATYAVLCQEPPESSIWIGLSVLLAIFLLAYRWAWNAPARELRGRGSAGAPRSGAEMRRRFLERTTYGEIAGMVGLVAVGLWKLSADENLFLGWNRLWLLLGALTLIMALVQAFRKWRFDSRRKLTGNPPAGS